MQARTTLPLTSISQAPQLPTRQAVGIVCPARRAASNQGWPATARLWPPPGQTMAMPSSAILLDRGGQQGFQPHMAFHGPRQAIQQPIPLAGVIFL